MPGKTQNNVIYVLVIAALIIVLSGCSIGTALLKLSKDTVWETVSEKQIGTFTDTLYNPKIMDTPNEKRTIKLLVDIVPAFTMISGNLFSGSINFYLLEDHTFQTWDSGRSKWVLKTTKMLCLFEVGLEKSPTDPNMFKIYIEKKAVKPELDKIKGYYVIFRGNKLFIDDRVDKTTSKPIPCTWASTTSILIQYTIIDKWLAKQKQALESKHKPIEPYGVFYSAEEITLFAAKK